MGQSESESNVSSDGAGAASEALGYEEIDVQDLASDPEAFKGRRVCLVGLVDHVVADESGFLVRFGVPVRKGFPGETQTAAAKYAGDVSALTAGKLISVKGVFADVDVAILLDFCGVTVTPVIIADSITKCD